MLIVMHAATSESDLVPLCELLACHASIASSGFLLYACQQNGILLGAVVPAELFDSNYRQLLCFRLFLLLLFCRACLVPHGGFRLIYIAVNTVVTRQFLNGHENGRSLIEERIVDLESPGVQVERGSA